MGIIHDSFNDKCLDSTQSVQARAKLLTERKEIIDEIISNRESIRLATEKMDHIFVWDLDIITQYVTVVKPKSANHYIDHAISLGDNKYANSELNILTRQNKYLRFIRDIPKRKSPVDKLEAEIEKLRSEIEMLRHPSLSSHHLDEPSLDAKR
jgi:hypothetical protein